MQIRLLFLLLVSISAYVSAQPLRDIADAKKVYIGNIVSIDHLANPATFRGGAADAHLTEQYNAIVLENSMKMSFVLPASEPANIHNLTVDQLQATLTTSGIEQFLSYPAWDDMRKRGHAMIWFSQAPGWLNAAGPTWTGQQVFDFSRRYILALGQVCGDRVDEWDVLNEAISDQAPGGQRTWRPGTWYRRANDGSMTDWGEATYENYVKMLFVWAREAQPNARLYYNDYAIENFDNSPASRNRFMRDKFIALKECGAPIDGIGFQSHFVLADLVSTTGIPNTGFYNSVEQTMEALDVADLDVAITELDIRICNNDRDEDLQEIAFGAVAELVLRQPNCRELLVWGLRDEDSWITLATTGFFGPCQDATVTEGNYEPKPAFDGLRTGLQDLADRDEYGFAPLNPGNGAPADCGGEGSLDPTINAVSGPGNIQAGETITVNVSYTATGNQDLFVVFQLDSDPYTVYATTQLDVTAGSEDISVEVVIPGNTPDGANAYQYQVFIAPDGGNWDNRFSNLEQIDVSVGDGVAAEIVSIDAPGLVGRGDTAEVDITYFAGEGQQVVVWFQLDEAPYTTFQEVRTDVAPGEGALTAKVFIPLEVPIAADAYQFQVLLAPAGGGWEERISNIERRDVDVEVGVSTDDGDFGGLAFTVYPNPTTGEVTVELPSSIPFYTCEVFSLTGQRLLQVTGSGQDKLQLGHLPAGTYVAVVRSGDQIGRVLVRKQ